MGVTYATVTVRNPGKPAKAWEGKFLVDTGAMDCLVPAKELRKIGIKPAGMQVYELPDGFEVEFPVAVAQLELMGRLAGGIVIFGGDAAEPIFGVTAMG